MTTTNLTLMIRDTSNFEWGILVRIIEMQVNIYKNSLVDYKDITETDMKHQAFKTWGKQMIVYTGHKNLKYKYFNTERVMRWH